MQAGCPVFLSIPQISGIVQGVPDRLPTIRDAVIDHTEYPVAGSVWGYAFCRPIGGSESLMIEAS